MFTIYLPIHTYTIPTQTKQVTMLNLLPKGNIYQYKIYKNACFINKQQDAEISKMNYFLRPEISVQF